MEGNRRLQEVKFPLPEATLTRLRAYKVLRGRLMYEVIAEALDDYLDREAPASAQRANAEALEPALP